MNLSPDALNCFSSLCPLSNRKIHQRKLHRYYGNCMLLTFSVIVVVVIVFFFFFL